MGSTAWHNEPMRWPWFGIQNELRLLREQHDRHIEEYRRFTTELVMDMRRHAEKRERAVDQRLEEIHEQNVRAGDDHERMLAHHDRMLADHDRAGDEHERMFAAHAEMIAELRAGREALFRMLDRLPPAPGTA